MVKDTYLLTYLWAYKINPKTPDKSGFEIGRESASLTRARSAKTILRVFSDSRQSSVRLSSSNDNFHNNFPLNNSNTYSFLLINRKCYRNTHAKLVVKACSVLQCPAFVFPSKVKKPVTKQDKIIALGLLTSKFISPENVMLVWSYHTVILKLLHCNSFFLSLLFCNSIFLYFYLSNHEIYKPLRW